MPVKKERRKYLSRGCRLAGSLLLFCALGLFLWNLHEGETARGAAARISEALAAEMPEPFPALRPATGEKSSQKAEGSGPDTPDGRDGKDAESGDGRNDALGAFNDQSADGLLPLSAGTESLVMPTLSGFGTEYLGILSIPGAKLELPVASAWDDTRLKESPCRFSGSYLSDDLVICGHNYAGHFWQLLSLPIGEKVYFYAADGAVYTYIVSNRETLQRKDVAHLLGREALADWDLSLVTCTPGGSARCVVRCSRI